jgi:tRNA(fMet)-specific endonuclease VapC
MSCLLDTNIWIAYLKGQDASVRDRMKAIPIEEILLCSPVKAELLYGARKSERVQANLARLAPVFDCFESCPFDDRAAEQYGFIRSLLERQGQKIGDADILIAAIAMAADATVVTRNEREFRRVPGLRVEVW